MIEVGQEFVSGEDYGWVMLNYLFNLFYPWFQMYTNPQLNGSDTSCDDSCSVSVFLIFVLWLPYQFIYGVPFVSMVVFWAIGQQIGLKGNLVKFFILYWSRYVGLLAHLLSLWLSLLAAGNDPVWAVLNPLIVGFLEYSYWATGNDAVTYVDPLWT